MKYLDKILKRFYSVQNEKDLVELCNSWSLNFDEEVVTRLGNRGHVICVQGLLRHFDDRNASILDVGCGTGLVVQTLAAKGFENIDGLDLSGEILSVNLSGLLVLDIGPKLAVRDLNIHRYNACNGGHKGPVR